MRRTLLLSLLVVGVGVALAAGSYSVLAGAGTVTSVASAVIGADEPDDGDVLNAVDADDVDGDEVSAQDGDDNAEGARDIAGLIEGEFGAAEGSVWALHETKGIGFGALFQLYALAAAMDGTSVDDLLAAADADGDGVYQFRFGELRKALTEDQTAALQAALESGPKNLGQLIAVSHPPEGAGPDATDGVSATGLEEAQGKFAAHASGGHGPPESVPAHGRN